MLDLHREPHLPHEAQIPESTDIEGIWVKITLKSTVLILGTFYRPPSDSQFYNLFHASLEKFG